MTANDPIVYFKDLHPMAELSGHEAKTSAYISRSLDKLGIAHRDHVGGYGIVGEIDSGVAGPTVLFRADMDALPYAEPDGSIVAVHACGHDAHCSMLLAAIPELKNIVKKGKLKLVFQPGEEDLTGALAMIKDGVLEGVEIAVGAHIRPLAEVPTGMICASVNHVACATVKVRFVGRMAHAARPHQGINPIDMAAQYVNMVNSIHLDPNQSWSTKATRIACEPGATNSLASWTELTYDLRAATNPLLNRMIELMQAMAKSVAAAYEGESSWQQIDYCPASDYDAQLVKCIKECVAQEFGEDKLIEQCGGGGEDFHFFKTEKPTVRTAYFGVGVGASPALHKREMSFDPAYMQMGVKMWHAVARKIFA